MRPPATLVVVSLSGCILGVGQAWTGLMLRLFPWLPSPFGPWGLWSGAGPRLLLDAQPAAWPLIAVGCAWLGVVVGLWLRLGWVRRVGVVLAAASAAALGPSFLLAAAALAGLLSPSLRFWLAAEPAPRG